MLWCCACLCGLKSPLRYDSFYGKHFQRLVSSCLYQQRNHQGLYPRLIPFVYQDSIDDNRFPVRMERYANLGTDDEDVTRVSMNNQHGEDDCDPTTNPNTTTRDESQNSGIQGSVTASLVDRWHVSPLLFWSSPSSQFVSDLTDDNIPAATAPAAALILLNSPCLEPSPSPLFHYLWQHCQFRICADGASNRLYQATVGVRAKNPIMSESRQQQQQQHKHAPTPLFWPDLIAGDLDSALPAVLEYYQHPERHTTTSTIPPTVIEHNPDQDCNDLDKALHAAHNRGYRRAFVFGAFGGRFDQEMASMQALYQWSNKWDQLWLYDDCTMAFLLPAHVRNLIQLALPTSPAIGSSVHEQPQIREVAEGPTCGLIPLGMPCRCVTTTGLQWNLHQQDTRMGGLVSTSNRILAASTTTTATTSTSTESSSASSVATTAATQKAHVTVISTEPLVFTAQVHPGRPSAWH